VTCKQYAAFGRRKEGIQQIEFLSDQGILKQRNRCLDGCSQILQSPLQVQRVEIHEPSRSSLLTLIFWMETFPPVFILQRQQLAFSFYQPIFI